jgi:small GTP-binding protein
MNSRLVKVVIVGDGNVGKTSLIRSYTEGKFSLSRVATIGVDFHTHTVELPDGQIKLSIWDMAGQVRFQHVRSGFYPGSRVAALVYDVTTLESLEHLADWRAEVLAIVPSIEFILVGNKIDLPRAQDAAAALAMAAQFGAPYVETSALTGAGIAELFNQLAVLAARPPAN